MSILKKEKKMEKDKIEQRDRVQKVLDLLTVMQK